MKQPITMLTSVPRLLRMALPAVFFLFAAAERATATTVTHWKNAAIGDWFVTSNWHNGLPGPGYAAYVSNGGTALLTDFAGVDYLFVGVPEGFTSTNTFAGTLIISEGPTVFGSLQVTLAIVIGGSVTPSFIGDGTVTISNGALLSQAVGQGSAVGRGPYGSTGRLTVTDPGSLASLGSLSVGNLTSHGIVTLQNGGSLQTAGAVLGEDGVSTGVVTLSGGAAWSLPNAPLNVGLSATGSVNVASGSSVRNGADANIGTNPGSNGSVTVTGNGSVWQTARIFVGGSGASSASGGTGALHILSGGQVQTSLLEQFSTGFVEVDNGSTSTPGLIVTGAVALPPAGSALGDFAVGNNGAGRMEISAGGQLFTSRGFMGGGSGSDGFVSITNSGSQWKCNGSVYVGNSGSGTLMLSDQGYLSSLGNGYIAFSPNTAGYVTVTDLSRWNMAGTLFVGGNGAAAGGSGTLILDYYAKINAAACVIYDTGGLVLGTHVSLHNPSDTGDMPITVRGGYIQVGTTVNLTNNITLESGGLRLYTAGNAAILLGHLTGSGGLAKGGGSSLGEGTLYLNGSSDYTGATTVDSGELIVTGSITSPVIVNSGATLFGTGTVGGITLNNNGSLYPGSYSSAGKLTANGNYNQTSGGILSVDLSGTGPGQFDQLAVSGAAAISGTLNVNLGTFRPNVGDMFQIITSNGATGEFLTINSPGCTIVSETSETGVILTVTGVFPVQAGPDFLVTNTEEHYDGFCTTDDCTLSEAINAANANPDASMIRFAPDVTGTIVHTDPNGFGIGIGRPVTIEGPGARVLTISGNNAAFLFYNDSNCTISGLTLDRGNNHFAGAIYNRQGQLTLRDCTISGNRSLGGLGGGAIFNTSTATLILERCTLSGNFTDQFGGGVYNDGTFTATNCTFTANTALRGGAIISRSAGGLSSSTLRNCTIANCTASSTNGGSADGGGGFYAEGGAQQVHLSNTIIARNNNSINPDVRGSYTSDGHNFIGSEGLSSLGFTNGVNGDQVGPNGSPIDPQLDLPDDNGGPTQTLALLSGSTAIDAGDDALAPTTDQRGYIRAGVSDIGAFEFDGGPPPTPTPTPTATPVTLNISGAVFYCSNPSAGPVPDVTMTLTGTSGGSTLSDGSGNYTFGGLVSGGTYTVVPSKAARTPGSAGINTIDVVATQRHFLNLGTPLLGCRLMAADVNTDSAVNTIDVIALQRFFLGMATGIAQTGKYKFTPPDRTYPAVGSDQPAQNYDTLILGDVASSFVHRGEGSSQTGASDDANGGEVPSTVAEVALPDVVADQTKLIAPVKTSAIDEKNKLVGFQGDFTFDERVVTFQSEPVRKAGITGGNWNVSGNVLPGRGPIRTLRVSAYSNDFAPLSGSGTLFELRMRAVSDSALRIPSGFRSGPEPVERPNSAFPLVWAAPPHHFIFIDADLNTQKPGSAASGGLAPLEAR